MDETEAVRRQMIASGADDSAKADRHWTTDELTRDFRVIAFMAPLVIVERKSDGVKGSLQFTHSPRTYFNWVEDSK